MLKPKRRNSTDDQHERSNSAPQMRGNCQMCGRGAAKHGVTLVPDECPSCINCDASGLWVVCLECSAGLRASHRSLGVSPYTLRRVSSYEDVHARIGELLRSFGAGRPVPSWLISLIARQASWRSRLRELRQAPFNWKIAAIRRRSSSSRVRVDYVLLRVGRLANEKSSFSFVDR